MKNLIKFFLSFFAIAMLVSGCKLDPPDYAEGVVTMQGTGTYTINGATTTRNNLSFVVTPAQGPTPASISIGNDIDFGIASELPSGNGAIEGIFIIGDQFGSGTVTFTTNSATSNSKGTVKGTFTGELVVDINSGTTIPFTGTFDISQ